MPLFKHPVITFLKWAVSEGQLFGVACLSDCPDYSSASGNPAMTNVAMNVNESAFTIEFRGEFTAPSDGTLKSVMFGVLVDNIPAAYIIEPVGRSVMQGRTYSVFLSIKLSTKSIA